MHTSANTFLVGPMGAGKTTIGRLLAKTLGATFCDSDREIELRTGVTIPMIFEYEGEAGFRKREAQVLMDLTARSGIVLATGGGSVLLEQNQTILASRGFVVYLYCSVDKQLERTSQDSHRPLLQTPQPRERLQELMTVRDPIYRSLADFQVDTGENNSRAAVRKILMAMGVEVE